MPTRFDRVEFVSLLACVSTAQAMEALCHAMRAEGSGDAHSKLATLLENSRTLLVLDNAEQLVADQLGDAIAQLLLAVPLLHVLVTSRQILDVAGESAFVQHGLPIPPTDASATSAADNPALALFLARARAARLDFHLGTAPNAQAAIALVRLLGGMPLAIELAASRIRSMSATELLRRLSQDGGSPMLELLARGAQGGSPEARHGSMRHTIAWSWQQLQEPQVRLLRGLSLTPTGARLEAVAALADASVPSTQHHLDDLVAASLVQVAEGPDGCVRYAMLQPVREFAAEFLADSEALAARHRLRRWLIGFVPEITAKGPTAIAPDLNLVNLAIATGPDDGEPSEALDLALSLRRYWYSAAPTAAVLAAMDRSLPAALEPTKVVLARSMLSAVFMVVGRTDEAVAHSDASIALACDDDGVRSQALSRWCYVRYGLGRFDSDFESVLSEALVLARRSGDIRALDLALNIRAIILNDVYRQYQLADQLVIERHALLIGLGDKFAAANALIDCAATAAFLGRFDEAIENGMACEAQLNTADTQSSYAHATQQLGRVYVMARRWHDAAAPFRHSIRVSWDLQMWRHLVRAMMHLPNALVMGSDPATAARLHGFGTTQHQRRYGTPNHIEARELRRTRRLLRHRLGAAPFATLMAEGAAMTMAQAVAMALEDSK